MRRDSARHGEEVALGDTLLERRDDLGVRDLLALEVALHELVGVLRHLVHQLLVVLLGLGLKLVRDLHLDRVAAAVARVLERLHVDQVDDAARLVLGADRDLGGDDVVAERGLKRLEGAEEVGALAVEHVHEYEPGEAGLVGAAPEALGVDLDAHDAVDDDDRGVDHPESRERVGDEARLARGVDQVDLAPVVLERGDGGVDRHLTSLLVGLEVGDGRAVLHLAEAVRHPGLEEDRLGEARLPRPSVADQGDVSNPVRRLRCH